MTTENTLQKRDGDKVEKMAERPTYAPLVDIYESKDEILIFADVPGVGSDDLAIHMDKDQLTIEARRAATGTEQAFDYKRTFVVPRGIDAENIGANLQNGVLKLTLPKSAAMKPRQIAVTAG
jgi:HSP20 family molecular chaperone IbpA